MGSRPHKVLWKVCCIFAAERQNSPLYIMKKKYQYKCITINFFTGQVCEFFGATGNKFTTLEALGQDGWEIVGSEYVGTKEACGGELKSASMWIAKREI